MADCKKHNGSTWEHSLRKLGTDTDTITTLPADVYADGTPLLDWCIKGNTVQSGTPTPQNPIQPSECGERTGNLWDEEYTGINTNAIYRPLFVGDGEFTLSTNFKPNGGLTDIFLLSGNVSSGIDSSTNGAYEGKNITAQSVNGYITIAYRANARPSSGSLPYCKTMLNTGSTALPYEPFGVKILISSASTTTPVYLGEVETTRRIKKLVLTGEESTAFYTKNTTSADNSLYFIRFEKLQSVPPNRSPLYCTHLQNLNYTPSAVAGISVASTYNVIYLNLGLDVMNTQPSGNTVVGLREYFAAQYAAGTPVTVWYILAEPEIGIVNEPLRKIGEDADEVSNVATIPTITGKDTFDVDVTLKPSEVELTYTGWHDAQCKEYDGSQWV